MSQLVDPYITPDLGGRDKFEIALEYVDKLLPICPKYDDFAIHNLIKKLDVNSQELANYLRHEIEVLFTEKLSYAKRDAPTRINISLTEEGRKAQSYVGHFEYERIKDQNIQSHISIAKTQLHENYQRLLKDINQSTLLNIGNSLFKETQILNEQMVMKRKVFIGCSVEGLPIAKAIQENLAHTILCKVWTQGVFGLSTGTLENLQEALYDSDYAIFVLKPDDHSTIKEKDYQTPRDNVIFELGLFMGRLGKEKVFFLVPRNSSNLHLPTDLAGITPGDYDDTITNLFDLPGVVGPFCNKVERQVQRIQEQETVNNLKTYFAGDWNFTYFGEASAQITEIVKIKNGNEYYKGENMAFIIKEAVIDKIRNILQFEKCNLNKKYHSIETLEIINENLLKGRSTTGSPITYKRIVSV